MRKKIESDDGTVKETSATATAAQGEPVQVRAVPVFKVRTINVGVAVSAVSNNEQGQDLLMDGQYLPAIFTTLTDALKHIDQLRDLIIRHFDEAAQIGIQVIASQSNETDVSRAEN